MGDGFKNDEERAKFFKDFRQGQEQAEADHEGSGPNTSVLGSLVGVIETIVDPSDAREAGYRERTRELANNGEEDESA